MPASVSAQEQGKAATSVERGRDPFKKPEPAKLKSAKGAPTVLAPPTIQERIERFRAQKMAAANAHMAAPKPTTALLLNETQVVGIFRTPRGWAAMIEAVPIKLSYVIYPGESFFDAQLVAIEENRLVFRRQTVWSDGRREVSQEVKPLRQPSPVDAMTNTAAAAPAAPTAVAGRTPEKSGMPEKQ
jgi:hypothetical protein